jgi:FKBP-type peptidyl-prolyl cis-trans isomerase 2
MIAAPATGAEEESTAVIENGSTVSLEYTLTLDDGSEADSNVGEQPLVYQQGNQEILPALEEALQGLSVGGTKTVKLSAAEGYGPVNPEAFQEMELEVVPQDARQVGALLIASDPQGNQRPVRVHEVGEETIILDLNHPLAGQSLTFDVRVLSIE